MMNFWAMRDRGLPEGMVTSIYTDVLVLRKMGLQWIIYHSRLPTSSLLLGVDDAKISGQ